MPSQTTNLTKYPKNNIMKHTTKLLAILFAAIVMTACGKDEPQTPATVDKDTQRTVIYTIGGNEGCRTVKDDTEWESMLDQLCDYAQQGEHVAFYSLGSHTQQASKEGTSISTTNREELKRWMKTMEREGKTVNVSYDDKTGTWNGWAYANIPILNDGSDCYTGVMTCVEMFLADYGMTMVPALIVGSDSVLVLERYGYILLCGGEFTDGDTITLCGTVESRQQDDGTEYLVLNLSGTSESTIAGSWRIISQTGLSTITDEVVYTFSEDGTVGRSVNGGTPESGLWSLSDDGCLCCDLFPDGGCWNINWLSGYTMIVSRTGYSAQENNNVYYVIQFEKVAI